MAPKRRPSALNNPPSDDSEDSQQPQNPSDDSDLPSERETADKPSAEKSDDESDTAPKKKPMTESPKPKKKPSTPKQASAAADVAEKKGKPNGKLRLWTEESELAALRAMHEYKFNKGLDPYSDTLAFFEFAKKSIPLEVTRNQVIDKLRRLKNKYENNAQKGGGAVFNKDHEHMAFEVSKKIWGSGAESGAKSAKRKSKRVEDSVEKESNKKAKRVLWAKGVEDSVEKESNNKAKRVLWAKRVEDSVEKETNKKSFEDDANEIVMEKGAAVGEGFKVDDEVGFWDKYPWLKEAIEVENNESFFKAMEFHLTKMGDAKAKELDDNWKRYQVKEAKLKLLKSKLVTKLSKVVLGELIKL